MASYVAAPSHHVFHHSSEDSYVDVAAVAAAAAAHNNPHHYTSSSLSDPTAQQSGFYSLNMAPQVPCDIKPRLTKEQHDILEAYYQKQSKPNTNTKKGFAESLNVSLDKVNNWFQNRRAKAKQDAKKQAGGNTPFSQQHYQQQASSSTTSLQSDSDTSPSFASADYFNMMQHWMADDQTSHAVSMAQFHEEEAHGLPSASEANTDDEFLNFKSSQQPSADMFQTPQDMNRRTLTQEQFDAFAQNSSGSGSGSGSGSSILPSDDAQFDPGHHRFPADSDVLHHVFPEMHERDFKPQDAFDFPAPLGAPLSSDDSSVPSTISEQSVFPPSTMQEHATVSSASSEWAESRSSSVSFAEGTYQQPPSISQPSLLASSQWQPGQSVPIDPTELQQQFREAAQRQAQQQAHHEQPLTWQTDEGFVRRESQSSAMLAQQMSSFAIQTPQPQESAGFKCPRPPGEVISSIAARRQRPRPAALGIDSLRSQSYSGATQPASPGATQSLAAPGQGLRRIRSSNVINGVAQGRVMKSIPGSAQRSPLNWTFADAMTSPKTARHASSGSTGNLAPPTPLSPSDPSLSRPESIRSQFPPWQSSSGHFSIRQESISETDAEHNVPIMSTASFTQPNVSCSPPHSPMFQHHHHHQHQHQHHLQQFASSRVGTTVITENTPPQSAPAAQQTFPTDVFILPQQPSQPQPTQPFAPTPQQLYINAGIPEHQFQVPAPFGPASHYGMPIADAQVHAPMQFANGVPIVNAQGHLTMAFPPQMQFLPPAPPVPIPIHPQQQQHPGSHYGLLTTNGCDIPVGTSPVMQMNLQQLPPKPSMQPAAEFFVHEYSPPQDIKRSATQRKVPPPQQQQDSGPKNYTFANQGPEHFEKDKDRSPKRQSPETIHKSALPVTGTASSNPDNIGVHFH